MNYRQDRYGNSLSVRGFGCMRFPTKLPHYLIKSRESLDKLFFEEGALG